MSFLRNWFLLIWSKGTHRLRASDSSTSNARLTKRAMPPALRGAALSGAGASLRAEKDWRRSLEKGSFARPQSLFATGLGPDLQPRRSSSPFHRMLARLVATRISGPTSSDLRWSPTLSVTFEDSRPPFPYWSPPWAYHSSGTAGYRMPKEKTALIPCLFNAAEKPAVAITQPMRARVTPGDVPSEEAARAVHVAVSTLVPVRRELDQKASLP